jgi:putative FmdB family regulatory protein
MLYDYVCDSCSAELIDVYQSIKDEPLTNCSSCGKKSLRRVIYGGLHSSIRKIETIGQLADTNWSKMGSYQRSEIIEKSSKSKESSPLQAFGSATRKEINKMTPAQQKKYIITGEK